jgi:disulfide bond formation protein DsbB
MSTLAANSETTKKRLGFVQFLQLYGGTVALLPAVAAMLGSLYYSEIVGFIPCTLCWYQRILMYPLTLIILVGLIKQDEYLPSYVLPFSMIGMSVSTYHYLMQWGVFANPASCSIVSCAARYVNYWGFITIPFMALTAFLLINIVMWATYWALRQPATE